MRYLLDTCVFAEYSNPRPQQVVFDWVDAQPLETLFISVLTVGEIEKGIVKLPSSKRRSGLENLLNSVIARFDTRILPLETASLRRWGKLVGELEKKGRPLPVIDSLLAATALEHNLTLVTRNDADFVPAGVKCLNIWLD